MMEISEAESADAAHASGLDHWRPIMHVNVSCCDVSKRLMQLRWTGAGEIGNMIMSKIRREAEKPTSGEQRMIVRRLKAVESVLKAASQPGGRQDGNRWVAAIFWAYSMEAGVHEGPGFTVGYPGDLIFSDSTATRFAMVKLAS